MTHPPSRDRISLEHALSIAHEAHDGQRRRHGLPYIGHPVAVRALVDDLAGAVGHAIDDRVRAIALLHDVVEDSEITAEELGARFGAYVGRGVGLLTKRGKGPDATRAYYERLAAEADDAVRLVKIADRVHNLSELHLAADPRKLDGYVQETLQHLVPLARSAHDGAVRAGLVAALHDGVRAACRAQGAEAPHEARLAQGGEAHRVPTGVYAIVETAARAKELVAGGVAIVQLRNKRVTDRELVALAEELLSVCRPAGVPVVVNDRADVCVAAGADGVHVGQGDLPPDVVRRIVGPDKLVGASSHTDPQLHALLAAGAPRGADHVAVGPVFPSPTKQGHAPVVGLDALAHRAKGAALPVVAIGGVTSPARAADVARAGAQLAAAVSALDVAEARVIARRMSASFFAARAAAQHRGRA